MKTMRVAEQLIVGFPNEVEAVVPVEDPFREHGIGDATFSINGGRSSADCR